MLSDRASSGASEGWALLRSGGGGDSTGLDIRTVPKVSAVAGPARLALGANGEARVLLPLGEREPSIPQAFAPSLRIVESTYSKMGKRWRFLDLTCLSKDLEPVFADVVNEVLSRIASGLSCTEAARGTLDDFRTLLLPPAVSGPMSGTVAGLVGELLILNRLIDHSPGAWRAWRGPAGDRHDFRSGLTSLEVKASLKKGKSTVVINGLHQLDTNAGGTLHLLHLVLEVSVGGLLSVAALGSSALSRADRPDELLSLLTVIGCPDPSAEQWNQLRFKLEDETLYEVGNEFPKIIGATLPGNELPFGVSELQYVVDLSAATSSKRDSVRQKAIEDELVKCL